tara:strand:- start:1701 stop:2090 length:390 start_codon:yes stop_codon:yes gene_type:complete
MNVANMPSQRQIRFGELIRSIISETIIRGDFFYKSDINLSSVTITFVKMSKDLKHASVYVMPLGGKKKDIILKTLNDNKNYFQKIISKSKLKAKFIPKINFYLDDSYDEAERIENLLLNKNVLRDIDYE